VLLVAKLAMQAYLATVVLLWVHSSSQVFLIGAEFTWVYANAFGSRNT
jgi:uncharacterized BrkB/YihY/UPF0761 family membrane protein